MKQKKQNRILAALLAVVMMFQMLPMMAFADEGGSESKDVAWIGDTGYTTLRAAAEAAQDGDTIKLGAGTYFMYDKDHTHTVKDFKVDGIDGKHLTLEGSGIGVTTWQMHLSLDNYYFSYDNCFRGADTITFKNMTLEAQMETGNSYADYRGFGGIAHTVVENCEVNGKTAFWGEETAEFINTTFNAATRNGSEPDYSLWTYITKEWTFDNCIFNAKGKVINVYTDANCATHDTTINFNNCTVNSNDSKYPALIIDDSNMGSHKYIVNITIPQVKAKRDANTCSQVFGFKGTGHSKVTMDGVCVWDNGQMKTHDYTDGEKDNAYNITYSSSNPNGWVEEDGHYKRHVIKTCKYCGYNEEKDENGYKLAYELNGGVDAAGADYTEKIVAENKTVTLAAAPAPAQEGVYFLGWDDENGKRYDAAAPITLTANTTLTAQWGDVPPVEPAGGGDGGAGAVVAGALLGGAGYLLGTRLWLESTFGFVPANRIELAMALWKRADCPAPVSTELYPDIDEDDTDAQAAARWCVEQDLMKDFARTNSDGTQTVKFKPYDYVFRPQSLVKWYKLEKLLNEQQSTNA
ncbi:InlB B-repeat-containing protein [Faecalibacterium prausnitzii]|uniref:InlB B-repeat-containing protein n=1 Tax=Faecalibacterium TaxID=216851 RepID=UPI0032EE47FD